MPFRKPPAAPAAERLDAARTSSPVIRVVVSPDAGASWVVSHHVHGLLEDGVQPDSIHVVSLTLQAARALRRRVVQHRPGDGRSGIEGVHFSSPHYLALNLAAGGDVGNVPADDETPAATWELREIKDHPHVTDSWEARELFDRGFSRRTGLPIERCREIRESHEALWCTGEWTPPNFVAPAPPVDREERLAFAAFHEARTTFYTYSLQGKSIRDTVRTFDESQSRAADALVIRHLVVENYQDLCPAEIQLIDHLIRSGVRALLVGDEDQSIGTSIGSTRFSWPQGFRELPDRHPECMTIDLSGGRPGARPIERTAERLLRDGGPDSGPDRPAASISPDGVQPGTGQARYWRYSTSEVEASAIADSCRRLIDGGMDPGDILIALPDGGAAHLDLVPALEAAGVPFLHPDDVEYLGTDVGHFVVACLDIIWMHEDYISYGALFSLIPEIDEETELGLVSKAIDRGLSVPDLFTTRFADGDVTVGERQALETVGEIVKVLTSMTGTDLLRDRVHTIAGLAGRYLGESAKESWRRDVSVFPETCTLQELKYCFVADDLDQWECMYRAIAGRLGEESEMPGRVRVAEMRYVKGVQAAVVFIPALEDEICPGAARGGNPMVDRESARRLYVAMTRARSACVVTSADHRGSSTGGDTRTPSRYLEALALKGEARTGGLGETEARAILHEAVRP